MPSLALMIIEIDFFSHLMLNTSSKYISRRIIINYRIKKIDCHVNNRNTSYIINMNSMRKESLMQL
jgi:hypothetical protein